MALFKIFGVTVCFIAYNKISAIYSVVAVFAWFTTLAKAI
jgi:energy-converting hydrogenase Eha subunit E